MEDLVPAVGLRKRLAPGSFLRQFLHDIKKHLTTHTARHTFATTATFENDVPIETVSQLLGHKSICTTQIYARITQHKIVGMARP